MRFILGLVFASLISTPSFAEPTAGEFGEPPGVLKLEHSLYPTPPRADVVEEKFGARVADPYRPLEDDHSPVVEAWVAQQNRLTREVLDALPHRPEFVKRLSEVWDYDSYGVPEKKGGKYFFSKKLGLQNQPILFVADSLDAEPRILIDPNEMSKPVPVSLSGYSVNSSGTKIAYLISKSGSDWQEIRLRDIATEKDESDVTERVKFSSATWSPDGKGYFYARFDSVLEPLVNQKVYFHEVGKLQTEDVLVYQDPKNPNYMFRIQISNDDKYLILSVSQGTGRENKLLVRALDKSTEAFATIIGDFSAEVSYLNNQGSLFTFLTNDSAPRGRVVSFSLENPGKSNWREIISQTADSIQSVNPTADGFIMEYLHAAASLVRVYDQSGKPVRDVSLPGLGTAAGFGAALPTETERFYSYSSFAQPPQIFRYDTATGESKLWKEAPLKFDASQFITEQIFAKSKDGTTIPVFVTRKKDLRLDGKNPTILYGYGGFNISLTPSFSPARIPWLERGGIYAVANLRGGGEFGDDWHNQGRLLEKQNVFDDFVASARMLSESLAGVQYTSPGRLVINGGSNGGLLVAATLNQEPDLFAGAIPEVGVQDMLRFHKFTIGWAWKSDYGDPEEEVHFRNLFKFSPVHNAKLRAYPPILIMTADHDDRVVPGHSFKYAAVMQAAQQGRGAILLRVQSNAGHGAGTPTQVLINAHADKCAFALAAMGL